MSAPVRPGSATARSEASAAESPPAQARAWARPGPTALGLAGLLLAALALRLWSIGHGLPYVYNPDEELHFVPRAVAMFRGSLNPGYFENPPALTYLLHVVFRVRFLAGFPFGASGFPRAFLDDPTAAYLTARVVVAAIGTAVVALVFWAGRRFFDARAGLVAAAIVAFAFLPVFYSKQALNDVVTLAPVTVALAGALMALERGRLGDWVLAGAAVGVSTATKYTAGAMLAVVGLAALGRWRRGGTLRASVLGLVFAGVALGVAFLALNPFAVVDVRQFLSEVRGQSATAGGLQKLGQDDEPGWLYYGWTLGWGFGVLPALAAALGAVLVLRRDLWRGLLLVTFPVLLFLFLGGQARYFGRWLMPVYPALAVLAGFAATWLADRMPLRDGRTRALVLTGLAVLFAGQGLISSVRSSATLGRADTRTLARTWMVAHVPGGSRVALEPFLPQGFLTTGGRTAPERYERFPVSRPFQAYTRRLSPALLDVYRRGGYCWVVSASYQRGRGLKAGLPGARAYYALLDRSSRRMAIFSPFRAGAQPVPFSFDLSFNYQPNAYARPGPVVEIRRLNGCRPVVLGRRT